ncbi:MAG: transporter, partial [Rhodanobacter sp.]
GVSVYGTDEGFHGNAKPGSAFSADASWEYSATRNWVLAFDLTYSHDRNTSVTGVDRLDSNGLPYPSSVRLNSGSSIAFGFAPAIEYNWNSNVGVLFGTRVIVGGRNTVTTVTPAVALNVVY